MNEVPEKLYQGHDLNNTEEYLTSLLVLTDKSIDVYISN
jgi:hypothetical protein